MRQNKRSIVVVFIAFFCVMLGCLAFAANINFVFATGNVSNDNLIKLCETYTSSLIHEGHSLTNYESYIDQRFQIGYSVNDPNLSDEQIMSFIPKQLFYMKAEDFSYVGESYGFYFDYNDQDETYLIYFFQNDWENSISGHLSRIISPIYYERYHFDAITGEAGLIYRDSNPENPAVHGSSYYEKYSRIKDLFIKDVTFTGHLFNECHPNIDEAGYVASEDNGGYFIGGNYQFKGVTTREDVYDFEAEIFKTCIGYVPIIGDAVGKAIDVMDLIAASAEFAGDAIKDFRNEVTNENNHDFTMLHVLSEAQIKNYGNLLKNYIGLLDTPNNANGVLLGIKNNNYAKGTFYYDFANDKAPWDTLYTGKVMFDIVQEINPVIGQDPLVKIATIKSNDLSRRISKNESTALLEWDTHELYALGLKEQKLNFTAPQNGEYIFETLGSVKNEFHAAKGTVTEKTDQTNQVLKVYLKKGERFEFSTKNLTNAIGRYNITVSYTPIEVKIGEKKTVDVAPGETEYFVFHYDELNPFTYSFDSTLNAEFAIHEGTPLAAPIFEYYDLEATGSYYKNYATKFYFSVKNNTADTLTANLGLSESKQLIPGQDETSDFIDNCIYKINPQVGSKFNITANAINSVKVYLYDQNMEEVYFSDSATTHSLDFVFKGNDIYFIKVVNAALGTNNFSLTLTYRPEQVTFGDNSITKPLGSYLYRFHSTADAEYRIVAGNAQVNIFGNDGTEIEPVNGMYRFLDNSDYYFKLEGSTTEITIGIDSTVNTNGNLSANGFVFVRFIPNLSYHYRFETSLPYQIYNRNLIPTSSRNMTKKETYYVRLNGEANQAYSIIINLDTVILSTYACQNVSAGYYSFDVSVTDEYNFFIYRNDGSTIELKYGNDIENLNTAITHEMNETFSPGKYYVKVEGAGFATVVMETKNQSATGKTDLHLGQKQTIDLETGNVNTLEFTNDKGLQRIRLTNESLKAANCEIHVFQKDLSSRDDVDIIKLEDKEYWELELGNGTYVFVIYCISTHQVTNALLELFIPNQLNGVSFGNSYVDFSNASNPSIELRMGVKYTLSFNDTDYASHQIGIEITGDKYVLQDYDLTFNVEANPYNRVIILEDDDKIYYINLVLVFPYSAEASIEDYYFGASIKSLVIGETPIGYEYVDATIFAGTNLLTSKSKKIDLAGALIFNQGSSLSCTVRIRIGNDLFSLKTNTVNFKNEVIRLSALNGSESARLYIDASSAANKTINIGSNVRALFLMGSTSVTHNVKFVFPNVNTFTLYTSNFKNISDKGGVFYGPNTSLNWYNEGTSSFQSNGEYVIRFDRLVLTQNNGSTSKISIQGMNEGNANNGTNGMYLNFLDVPNYTGELKIIGGNGGNGRNGTNGADATRYGENGKSGTAGILGYNGGIGLFVYYNFNVNSAQIICQGGNGGNGGNGGDGGKGGSGARGRDSANGVSATRGGDGGNGGHGGDAGSGGYGGHALVVANLNYSSDYNRVTCKPGRSGNGGNAGNGGDGGNAGRGGDDHWFWSDSGDCHCGGNGGDGGSTGRAAIGGYQGISVTNLIDNIGIGSSQHGSYGTAGAGGMRGPRGDAGAAGSPNGCEKGKHFTSYLGAPGTVVYDLIDP